MSWLGWRDGGGRPHHLDDASFVFGFTSFVLGSASFISCNRASRGCIKLSDVLDEARHLFERKEKRKREDERRIVGDARGRKEVRKVVDREAER